MAAPSDGDFESLPQQEERHLFEYLDVVLRRKALVLAVFVAVGAISAVRSFMTQSVYQATAQILIDRETPNVLSFKEVTDVNSAREDYFQTQYKLLQSRALARRVVEGLNLMQDPEFGGPRDAAGVVRLPFIAETSLGHEIVHQWFGNSVLGDHGNGNWEEGLTTYLADHWYEEQKGKGWEYRKQLLVNYGAYVNSGNEFPLSEFRSRMDLASRAIGYGKAAMVFHLLRTMAGDEMFFGALRDLIEQRQFATANWDDIRDVFAKWTGRDLSAFFRQWVEGKGLVDIRVENPEVRRKGRMFELTIEIARKNTDVAVELPLTILFLQGGEKKLSALLDSARKEMTLLVEEEPAYVVFDRGGSLAGGRQSVSWIHQEDFCRAVEWIIEHESHSGPVNLAAPNPVPNAEFMATIRRVCHARFGLPATRWMLEIGAFFLRTESELLIKSRRVVPGKLLAGGFVFRHLQILPAIEQLVG